MDSYSTPSPTVRYKRIGDVAVLTPDRPEKRNAMDTPTVSAMGDFCKRPPTGEKAVVLAANGNNFSAELGQDESTDDEGEDRR